MTLKKRLTSSFIFLFALGLISAQESVVISGSAPHYAGKEIVLFGFKDHLSDQLEYLDNTLIDTEGDFELKARVNSIRYVGLRADHVTAYLYVQPETEYSILFPPPAEGVSVTFNDKARTEVLFNNLDLSDINALIIDFNGRYEAFFAQNYELLSRIFSPTNTKVESDSTESQVRKVAKGNLQLLTENLDDFIISMDSLYSDYDGAYFQTYRQAVLGDLLLNSSRDDRRGFFERFIADVEFDGQHLAQSELEERFFHHYFLNFAKNHGGDALTEALNVKGSYSALKKVTSKDDFLNTPERRDRILSVAIAEVWDNRSMDRENLAAILDSIAIGGNGNSHEIAADLLLRLSSMNKGFPAHAFQSTDQFNDLVSIPSDKDKRPIVLEFWAEWCTSCEKERAILRTLSDKFGKEVRFVSINMDDESEAASTLTEDKAIHHLTGSNNLSMKEFYKVQALPQYTVIDQNGLIYEGFAPVPSKGLEKVLGDLLKEIPREKGPQVGSRENR